MLLNRFLFFFASCILFNIHCTAQDKIVSGKVTAFNTYPLKRVEIASKKAKETTHTDSLGNFSIRCKEKDILKIVAEGFISSYIQTKNIDNIVVNLVYKNRNNSFDEAVENNYIYAKELEYAIENLIAENNDYSKYLDIFQLIQSINPSAGISEEGGIKRVFIGRGPQSISLPEYALLVVDGVIVEDISAIAPIQVKSIDFLIGADASQYGSRGGCGVVEISLKHK